VSVRHVAFVLTQDRGGPVDLTVALARELADRDGGPRVSVIGPPPLTSAGDISDLLIPVHVRKVSDLAAGRRVAGVLRWLSADVVHAQDRRAGLMCSLARPPASLIGTYHGLPEDIEYAWVRDRASAPSAPRLRSRAVLAADAAVARRLPVTVTPSAYMARFLREGLRVPPERLRVIFNGAPLPQVRPLPTVVRTMTYVGQLGPVKSVGTLLEALALLRPELPDLHLRIVGDGPLRAELEARADRPDLAGGVSFVGYRTDVPAQLALADAFVLPSVNENQPLALLEAMGAGLACVASHVGGIPEVLADTGLLVPPGDAPALARALRRLAMERGLAADLGNRAAERARDRYSIARCADSHLELYGELVATGRSPSMDRLPSRSRAGRWPVVAPVPTVPTSAGGRPSFSVVIAAYQAAGTVGAAVESALTQTYSPLEVIVCDDGSTDDIAGALQSYRGRIRLIHKDNGGESSAKNSAAAVASGDFVVLLDADDSWMPRRLEALAALSVARPDLDILTTNATVMVNGEDAGPYYPLRTRFDVDDQRIAILGSNFVFGSCAIRRYRWEGLGGFDESLRIAADWDLIQRLILTGSLAGVLDLPLARYNLSRASLSGDEVGLWRHRIELTRSALVRYQLRPAERQVCNRQVAHYERELRLAQARRAVREGIPDARRLSIAVVGSPDYGLATRAKALTAALLPAVAASLPPPDRLQ